MNLVVRFLHFADEIPEVNQEPSEQSSNEPQTITAPSSNEVDEVPVTSAAEEETTEVEPADDAED